MVVVFWWILRSHRTWMEYKVQMRRLNFFFTFVIFKEKLAHSSQELLDFKSGTHFSLPPAAITPQFILPIVLKGNNRHRPDFLQIRPEYRTESYGCSSFDKLLT